MQAEPVDLCILRPEIVNLELGEALALILNCHAVDAERARRVDLKFNGLVDWINEK